MSVGIVDGVPLLDLCYEEDVRAETDMNVVMTGDGRFVEVQGTAEGEPFDRALLDSLLDLAATGCAELTRAQAEALARAPGGTGPVTSPTASPGARQDRWGRPATRRSCWRRATAEARRARPDPAPLLPAVEVLGLDDVPAYDEPAETGATFAGNALLKARTAAAATGLPAVADDSGLCVDALNGMPGVLSARWSGRPEGRRAPTTALLLEQLADVPDDRRGAAFVACAVLVVPGGSEHVVEGRVGGTIAHASRGGRRLRLRPDVRARGRDAHVRRALAGGEGRDQPPRPGVA